MTYKLSKVLGIMLCICGTAFAENLAESTLMQNVPHVTDTIYVIDKPDTVYLPLSQKPVLENSQGDTGAVSDGDAIEATAATESQAETKVAVPAVPDSINGNTELPPPKILIRLKPALAANLILIAFNSLILDFGFVFENQYRGAIVVNPSLFLQFGDIDFMSHEKSWEGFRNTFGIEAGYRQYLGTTTIGKPDYAKSNSRNTPKNSVSFYVQGNVAPTFLYANDKELHNESKKEIHFVPGIAASATCGLEYNIGLMFDMSISGGYQYWRRDDKRIFFANYDENFSLFNGSAPTGFFFKFDVAIEL